MAYIVNVDKNFEPHINIIMKLSKRNDFYVNAMYLIFYKKLRPLNKENLLKSMTINECNLYEQNLLNQMPKNIEINFICIKKKVCGFLFMKIHEEFAMSEILFLLIDKSYQNQGLGTIFINYLKEKHNNDRIIQVNSDIEHVKFYEKFNFMNTNFCDDYYQMFFTKDLL